MDDRGLRQPVEDLALGQGERPRAQDALDRIELVDAQPADQRAQGGGLDQQGEQDEAGGQHRDEVAHLGRNGRRCSATARASASVTAPRTPPQRMTSLKRELIGRWRSSIRTIGSTPQRHKARADRAPTSRAASSRRSLGSGLTDGLGHQHRGQHEHERARPEAELAPDDADALPFLGADPHPADGAEHEPGRDHRDHAGDVQIALGQRIGEVGQGHAEGHLGRAALVDPADQDGGDPPQDDADRGPADEVDRELDGDVGDDGELARRRRWRSRGARSDGEQGDGRGVVEQALAFDQQHQPAPRAHLAEHGGDGAGVGGGDDRGYQQAGGERWRTKRTRRQRRRRPWSSARRPRPGSGSGRHRRAARGRRAWSRCRTAGSAGTPRAGRRR